MILVCDRTESARAARIREELYRMGCPAAVCAIPEYRTHLPARLIVTFTDALDALRQTPLDHLHAIVLGNGFVNSALNAQALRDDSASIPVHISTLNKKARESCGMAIIETMRFSGYRALV